MDKIDVFISYKKTYNNRETEDAAIAKQLSDELISKGLSVVCISDGDLQEEGFRNFKKAVDKALDDAFSLVVIGSKLVFVESAWSEYEYETFHRDILILQKPNGVIVPYISKKFKSVVPPTLGLYHNYYMEDTRVDELAEIIFYHRIINGTGVCKDTTSNNGQNGIINTLTSKNKDNQMMFDSKSEFKQKQFSSSCDVFISYSRKDKIVADKICESLEKAEISFFIDREGIGVNHPFKVIANAIKNCKIVLFLGSKNSYMSKYATKEINYAIKNKNEESILPFLIDNSEMPDEIDLLLADINQYHIKSYSIEDIVLIIQKSVNHFY